MQGILNTVTLPVAVNGTTTPIDLRASDPQVWVQITGTFTATFTMETSLDGTTWVDAKDLFKNVVGLAAFTNITTPQMLTTNVGTGPMPAQLRFKCTAYTSGTATALVQSRSSRTP